MENRTGSAFQVMKFKTIAIKFGAKVVFLHGNLFRSNKFLRKKKKLLRICIFAGVSPIDAKSKFRLFLFRHFYDVVNNHYAHQHQKYRNKCITSRKIPSKSRFRKKTSPHCKNQYHKQFHASNHFNP